MSATDWKVSEKPTNRSTVRKRSENRKAKLHKVREVRHRQGVSLRTASKRLGMDIRDVREMEKPWNDLSLTMLYRWHQALEVPVDHLLAEEEEGLSGPVLKRARMIRLMKTATAIKEGAKDESLQRMAGMMVEQLVEVMPELSAVNAWHAVGQPRLIDECGRIVERQISDDWFASAAYPTH